jgi:putative hydrolase of HD superfamily
MDVIAERLSRQIEFIKEIDKLKRVLRQTVLMDGSRQENDAEHSWHLAMMVLLLAEYAAEPALDRLKVLQMVLVHDIVEIDAGDTFCYDDEAAKTKSGRERLAADRLFGMLPTDQGAYFRALWDEFEARITPEARFAAAIDRLQPLLHNVVTEGAAWRKHGVTLAAVLQRNAHIAEGAPVLWGLARAMVEESAARGHLAFDGAD